MLTVLEVNHLGDLDAHRSVWAELLKRTPEATFFQSLDWLEVYWRHFGQEQQLRVLLVQDRGQVVGIVPLTVRSIRTRFGRCRILTYPFDDWGSFYGPIAPDGETTLAAALDHVRETRWGWDLIDLRNLRTAGSDGCATERAMQRAGLSVETFPWDQAAFVNLQQDWTGYFKGRTGKVRRAYRRAERLLADEGRVEYVRCRPAGEQQGDGDARWDLYDTCEEIARKSWQGSSTTGTTLTHDSIRSYLRDTHEAAARGGAADINLVYLNGTPAAFSYNYCYQGWVYSLRIGFDPNLSTNGLGRLLLGRMIQDSMARGDRVLDLGVGSLETKKRWLTSIETSGRCVYYSKVSPRARLLNLSHRVADWYRDRFGDANSTNRQTEPQPAAATP